MEQSFFRRTFLLATGDVPLHYVIHYSNNDFDYHINSDRLSGSVKMRKWEDRGGRDTVSKIGPPSPTCKT